MAADHFMRAHAIFLVLSQRLAVWRRALWSVVHALATGEMSLVAAGCAFYATLAVFPAMTTLISLYGLVFDARSVEAQLSYLHHFIPPTAYELLASRIQHLITGRPESLGIGLAISLIFTLYSAASGTKSLIYALNLIHRREESRGIIRFQLMTLGMTLLAILGAALAIGVLVVLPLFFTLVGLKADAAAVTVRLGFIVLAMFMALALGLLYRFGPSFPTGTGHRVIPGAVAAVLVWILVSYGFALYVGKFAAYSQTYGPLATIVGLMMWFYLTAYAVVFGALLNAALERERFPSMHRSPRKPDPDFNSRA